MQSLNMRRSSIITLNLRVTEEKDVVVISGLEFPNVVVQGKTKAEAKKDFLEAVDYFFTTSAEIEMERDPLLENEKIETLHWKLTSKE